MIPLGVQYIELFKGQPFCSQWVLRCWTRFKMIDGQVGHRPLERTWNLTSSPYPGRYVPILFLYADYILGVQCFVFWGCRSTPLTSTDIGQTLGK